MHRPRRFDRRRLDRARDDTGTSAAGKIVFTTNDHIFEGEGRIEDVKSTGAIEIAGDIRFTNRLTDLSGWAGIHGSMTIKGLAGTSLDGELRNEGRVRAMVGAGDTLTLAAELSDIVGAQWITSCQSILLFKREALTLNGDFLDNLPDNPTRGGTFKFESNIWTCGTFIGSPVAASSSSTTARSVTRTSRRVRRLALTPA